jgi:hypothetical protein
MIDSVKDRIPSIEIGFDVSNRAVFWGRTYGVTQYSAEPSVSLQTGNGIYFYNTNYYWSEDNEPSQIAKSEFGLGYYRDVTDNLFCNISYDRWHYFNGDHFEKNAVKNAYEFNAFYDLNILNFGTTINYLYGTVNFWEVDFKINQEFFIGKAFKHSSIYFFPEFVSVLANKNFIPIYSDYPNTFVNENKFRCINLELNLPLRIQTKNMAIEPICHFDVPIKQPQEDVNSINYFSLKIIYSLYYDKHNCINKMYQELVR